MLRLLLKVISVFSFATAAISRPFSFHDPAWLAIQSSSSVANSDVFTNVAAVWHFELVGTDSVDSSTVGGGGSSTHWGFTNGFHNFAICMTNENTGSSVQVSDNSVVSAGSGVSFTYTFWMNDQGGTDSNNPLLAKWNNAGVPSTEYVCAFVKPSLGLIWQCNNLAGSSQPFVKTNAPTSSAWHFVAVGYDDSLQQIWLQLDNGARVNTSCVGVRDGNASLAFLNYSQDGGVGINSSWLGFLDEIYLWKVSLTTTKVSELWNGGLGLFYTP